MLSGAQVHRACQSPGLEQEDRQEPARQAKLDPTHRRGCDQRTKAPQRHRCTRLTVFQEPGEVRGSTPWVLRGYADCRAVGLGRSGR